jgi:hypothetical protein
VTQRAVATVSSWQGMASINFRDRCGDYGSAADAAARACDRADHVLARYAQRLEEAREHVKRLQDQAQDCLDRINAANQRATDAAARASFASHMAYQASMASGADGGASAADFRAQADDARSDQQAAEDAAGRAQDELDRLRKRARQERERMKETGRVAASMVDAANSELPAVTVPPPPAPPAKPKEDKPWYEDAADAIGDGASWTGGQLLGVGKGVGEGVVGIGKGGVFLYRLSSINQTLDPGSYDQATGQLHQTASFAWNHPGDFGKAVANWDDLKNGRYGEWLGNLAPDAALAFFTAGSGTAATRGLRGAEALDEVGDAARATDRVAEASSGARRFGPATGAGPLGEAASWDQFRQAMRSGSYTAVTPDHPRNLYRVYGGDSGQLSPYWSSKVPAGRLQAHIDFALPPGNSAERIVTIRVPAGVEQYDSFTAQAFDRLGGGQQTIIPKVDPKWIVRDAPFP